MSVSCSFGRYSDGPSSSGGQPGQLRFRESLLDQREELALLAADVLLKLHSQALQALQWRRVRGDIVGQPSDYHVLDQHSRNDRLIWVREPGERG